MDAKTASEMQPRLGGPCRQLALIEDVNIDALVPPGRRAVILAAHPGDEVLACGGLLQLLSHRGHALQLISITDGQAAPSRQSSPEGHSVACAMESTDSLRRLGIPLVQLKTIRGRFQAGDIENQENALLDFLMRHLRPNDVVFSPWRSDSSADHEAVGRVAQSCTVLLGAQQVEMPLNAWRGTSVDDPRIPWWRARKLALDITALARKRHAMNSQASHCLAPKTVDRNTNEREQLQLHWELFFV
ncbi:PIG-L deacetylase family protein [Pseudomonas sp. B392_1p]|jgi:LmbE family N-acetylglucosaminyl deacetylase|uniref:PIG-L deacetylase family protein n=1 Tax=Pseudomonas sp. B392_1p TaxID=3457507 RepID=UPI003FD31793